jgi:hypothetical protein
MNDFTRIVLAFGRGLIKLLISVVVGVGVGLLVIGITTANRPELWQQRGPPGEVFIAVGAGLLSGGGTLALLFFAPWFKRPAGPEYLEDRPIIARPASRPMRLDPDDSAAPPPRVVPKPRHDPDDSTPRVRPVPPPEEPGHGGFYEK